MQNYTNIEDFFNDENVFRYTPPEELEINPVPKLYTAEGYFQLYKHYVKLHQVEKAEIALEEAIRLDKNNISYLKELGVTHYPLCYLPNNDDIIRKVIDEESINKALDRLIKLGVNTAAIYHSRAKAFVLKPPSIESIECFDIDNGMDGYKLALKDINKAIELEPDNAQFYLTFGELYQYCGEYDKALKTYDKVTEINPYNAIVYYRKAQIYFEQKHDDLKAMQELNIALNYDESYPEVHRMKGLIYEKYNRNLEAINSIENYLKYKMDTYSYTSALDNKAELHHKEKEYKEELKILDLLILLDSGCFKIDYIKRKIKVLFLTCKFHKIIPEVINLLVNLIVQMIEDFEIGNTIYYD